MSAPWWSSWQGRIYLRRSHFLPVFLVFLPASPSNPCLTSSIKPALHNIHNQSTITLAAPKKSLQTFASGTICWIVRWEEKGVPRKWQYMLQIYVSRILVQQRQEANTPAFGIYTALEQYTVGLGIYSYWPKAGETGGFVLNPRCTISSTWILHKFLNECKVCYVRCVKNLQSQWAFTCTPQMILNVAFKAPSFEYAQGGEEEKEE